MAAGDIDDPLTNIPNVAVVDQSAATAAPGAGYARIEAVNGVLGVRVGAGAWAALLDAGTLAQLAALTLKATPVADDLLLVEDSEASGAKKRVPWSALPGTGSGMYTAYLHYQDQKAQGTDGGSATSGSWQTRTLNTELSDTAGIGSLSSNEVTLPAGTYLCRASAPAFGVSTHQARLYNVTGAAALLVGSNGYSNTTNAGGSFSLVEGRFTLAVESAIRLEHRVLSSHADHGYGSNTNWGTEVYSDLQLWKE